MMNKKRSNGIGRTKYLIFIPLAAFLMLLSNIEAVARITGQIAADAVAEVKEATEISLVPAEAVKVKGQVIDDFNDHRCECACKRIQCRNNNRHGW